MRFVTINIDNGDVFSNRNVAEIPGLNQYLVRNPE